MFAMLDRVHPDAIAEERAAGLAPRRIDRDDGDPQPVVLVETEPPDDFVGERALARAAGSGHAERRRLRLRRGGEQNVVRFRGDRAGFEARDHPGKRARARGRTAAHEHHRLSRQLVRKIDIARGDDFADHSLQPEPLPVLRGEDPRDAVVVQLVDLVGNDHAAATAEHLDVAGAALAQKIEHVLEELDVPALVRRDRDAVRVLLDRAVDDLVDRAVVAEVDHLATGGLEDPPHDVDRRVVAVEQRRRGDEADLVERLVDERRAAGVVHGELLRGGDPGVAGNGSLPPEPRPGPGCPIVPDLT